MVESIVTVVLEVVKCLAPPTERQISYLRSYDNNLVNLRNEIEKLKGDRESVQHEVDEAKRKGEEIENNVQTWLASVDEVIVNAETFVGDEDKASKRCFKGLCPNLKTRHRLSKEAVRQLEALVKLRGDRGFNKISYSTVPDDLRLLSGKDYYGFESRMSTLNNILGSLKNPDINMLGIYGMGGIGKTTLAKEVGRLAKSEKLFDQVVFVEVSQSPNIKQIQGEIADNLGLKFDEESKSGRAMSLCNRLKKERTILVILDNIWDELNLLDVGIPQGDDHKGCKVLLTARSEDILLRKMDSRRNFSVSVLDEKEAWSLFQKTVGDDIEGNEFESVAKDVAKECAGLPISIVPVAKALRKKRLFEWNDALNKLRRPSSTDFRGIQPAAYSAIELSYNALQREELKKIFLLIGYAYIKNINDLLMCGMGLGLFQSINKMEEAQIRVRTLIQELKDSSLLLDEDLSMHDVVRDVAISIASTQQNVLLTTNGEIVNRWELSDEYAIKHHTSIVLLDVEIGVLSEELNCPHLELFYVRAAESSSTISDHFFIKMKQIRVLILENMNLQSLPSSLGLLTNLRTLCLYDCKLQDIAGIGDLKKLVILCLRNSEIQQLPTEIGQLIQLKLLDLRGCWKLNVIPPNVLSNLSHLEELYIGDRSFNEWEEVEGLKNASLDELKNLHKLTSLEINIKDVKTLPRDLFFEKLKRYKINICRVRWSDVGNKYCRIFQLELKTNVCLRDGLIVQLQEIEQLGLRGLQEHHVKNFVDELVKVGSSQLKYLLLQGSDDSPNPRHSKKQRCEESINDILKDDVNVPNSLFKDKVVLPHLEALGLHTISNIDRIWPNQVVPMSCGIQKLANLVLYNCRNLLYLFSSSIFTSFVQLQHLYIVNCSVFKEIIVMDQEEMKNIMFPQLQVLKMKRLSKLTSFCSKNSQIEFPSLKELRISDCPEFMVKYKNSNQDSTTKRWEESTSGMQSTEIILEDDVNVPVLFNEVVVPNLEILELHGLNVERIWPSHHAAVFQNLTMLSIRRCMKLKWLFSSSIISSFIQLGGLEIGECPVMEEIIVVDQKERNDVMFPQLKFLNMRNLPKLTNFCSKDSHIEFSSLKELRISDCFKFMVKHKDTNQDSTKKRWEESTSGMQSTEIILEDNVNVPILFNEVVVPNLEILELYDLNVERIWPSHQAAVFQNLTKLSIRRCMKLKWLFPFSIISSFTQLGDLEIEECPIIEEIIVVDKKGRNDVMFPQLKFLNMRNLPKLTNFCSKDLHIEFPSLKKLWISDCFKFMVKYKNTNQDSTKKRWEESTSGMQSTEIILEDDVNVPILFNEVVVPNLEILKLYNLNVGRIWPSHHAANFQNLTKLCIRGCMKLKWLFTSSIISSFIQLGDLEIEECPVMEEIIIVDQKERNDVIFPKLEFLKMTNLPKLTCFFSQDLHVKFPSMKKLEIFRCLEFMVKYKSTADDLIKKVCPNLKDLRVEAKHMPWICSFPEDFLCKLKCLYVEFDESTTILSLDDFLQRLHNVKFLHVAGEPYRLFRESNINGMTLNISEVNKCCDLKHILKKESSILDNLEMLLIYRCENLINLVPSMTSFQNLTTLLVWSCEGLRNVLTTSTAKSLMRLREMGISNCNMITEIVADDEGDNAAKNEIVFGELKKLDLRRLDGVRSFCSGIRAFKFPSLEKLLVVRCPNMKVFSERELWTPKLHKVQIEEFDESWIWEKDLNTSIQQLYLKKKEADEEENEDESDEEGSEDEEESDQVHEENNAEASESRIPKEDLGQPSMQHLE